MRPRSIHGESGDKGFISALTTKDCEHINRTTWKGERVVRVLNNVAGVCMEDIVCREEGENRLEMFNGESPFSFLHIERLELCVFHSLQPLQVFDHLGVILVLDRFSGSLIDGPTSF